MIVSKGIVSAAAITILAAAAQAQGGSITGIVQDSTGKRLSGVTVVYRSLQGTQLGANGRRTALPPEINSSTVTNDTGAFQVSGLPAGQYYLCSLAAAPGQLPSCSYGPRPVVVSVGPSGTTSVTLINVIGSIIRIHVTDKAGAIAEGQPFVLGSRAADGSFEFAKFAGQSSGTLTYELTIPNDRVSRLVVDTNRVVTDSSGTTVPLRQPWIALPTGAAPSDISLVVE